MLKSNFEFRILENFDQNHNVLRDLADKTSLIEEEVEVLLDTLPAESLLLFLHSNRAVEQTAPSCWDFFRPFAASQRPVNHTELSLREAGAISVETPGLGHNVHQVV